MNKDFDIKNLIRDNVAGLLPYSSARDEFKSTGQEMVFLDANENPFDNAHNRYPDPQQKALKNRIAELKNSHQNQILLGNGSDEVLDLIFRAFCEPRRDNIITLPPTYGMYNVLADINAIQKREVLLTENFELKENDILEKADEQSKILFICSPNNPTGNTFQAEKIEFLLDNFKGFIVIDEAYADFSSEESWLKSINKYPNLIVTQTLSKAYGMAGIRLGMCFASTEIIAVLNKIKPPYNVNKLTQEKALERLHEQKAVGNEIAKIKRSRGFLAKALKEVAFVQKIYPTEANFILAKVDNAEKRYNELKEKGIVVRNRDNQPLCRNCLRFTVGTKSENKKLITALSEIQ